MSGVTLAVPYIGLPWTHYSGWLRSVKITPFPYDDILLDIVWSGVKKAVRK